MPDAAAEFVVIGAGAAGMLAAARAGQRGVHAIVLEKNRKPGVKILMSGGTRCNLTHHAEPREIVAAFGKPGKFLHSALAALGPRDVVALFERAGVPTKVESTGKVFPVSDRALDVQQALVRLLRDAGAELALDEPVEAVERQAEGFVVVTPRRRLAARRVLIAVGGQSYPGCGTRGDGYRWAADLGHTIVPPRPALAPLASPAGWVHDLQGLTLADARIVVAPRGARAAAEARGGLLFTHWGLSGPAPMNVSRAVSAAADAHDWTAVCDLLPDCPEQPLAERLFADGKRTLLTAVSEVVPRRLGAALLEVAQAPGERRVAEASKRLKGDVVAALKRLAVPLSGTLGFAKAEVTAGGVDLGEVDSRTLESKLCPGLYFAGEVLDLDGPIGGYNFQAAFSTGWLAAERLPLAGER
jgi:predicted Rossmann fold flavoprotein